MVTLKTLDECNGDIATTTTGTDFFLVADGVFMSLFDEFPILIGQTDSESLA